MLCASRALTRVYVRVRVSTDDISLTLANAHERALGRVRGLATRACLARAPRVREGLVGPLWIDDLLNLCELIDYAVAEAVAGFDVTGFERVCGNAPELSL